VRLTAEAMLDIRLWLHFAESWNQKSFFYDDEWTQNTDILFATDASDAGFGGVFGNRWFMQPFAKKRVLLSIA
jgi:hypothetical protein